MYSWWNTPAKLHICMTCTPLISEDAKGINQDFRFEMKKICTHLRGGSDIAEQRLCVHVWFFCALRVKSSLPLPLQLSIATTSLQHRTIASKRHQGGEEHKITSLMWRWIWVWTYKEREKSAVPSSRCSEEVLTYKQETVRTVDVTAPGEVEVHPTSNTRPYSSKLFQEFRLRTQFSNC